MPASSASLMTGEMHEERSRDEDGFNVLLFEELAVIGVGIWFAIEEIDGLLQIGLVDVTDADAISDLDVLQVPFQQSEPAAAGTDETIVDLHAGGFLRCVRVEHPSPWEGLLLRSLHRPRAQSGDGLHHCSFRCDPGSAAFRNRPWKPSKSGECEQLSPRVILNLLCLTTCRLSWFHGVNSIGPDGASPFDGTRVLYSSVMMRVMSWGGVRSKICAASGLSDSGTAPSGPSKHFRL